MSLGHVATLSPREDESLVRVNSLSGSPFINGADELYLVISDEDEGNTSVDEYTANGKTIERRSIPRKELMKAIFVDANRQVTQWILLGEVVQDPAGFIAHIRKEMNNQHSLSHKKKIYIDFARFFRGYMEAKEFLNSGHLLDSFNSILQSLHHWAKLAILEVGEHPETTVWEQIKVVDPSVYKLYEELVTSPEPLQKRIELLLLALDFTVLSKMEKCVQFILDIIKSRKTPWTMAELLAHPDIADPYFDIFLLLDKMAKRSLISKHTMASGGVSEKGYAVSYTYNKA